MNIRHTRLLPAIGAAALLGGLPSDTAQAQSSQESGGQIMEEVVVKGLRYSLREGLDVKRESPNVVDSIVAEDIGKFPDENVAQSLQRIAGVAINRPRGNSSGATNDSTEGRLGGQFVQIRGLPVDFTQVTLNGRALASGRNVGRQFSLDVLPSEFIGRMDVYKTVSADQIEGGIGGNADIRTRLPLDSPGEGWQGAGSLEGVYTDLAEKTNPKASGIAGTTFADGTMGLLLGGTYSERQTREDEYFSWSNVNFGAGVDERADLATVPNGTPNANATYPTVKWPIEPLTALYLDERKQTGLNGVFQWRPDDTLELLVDGLYSRFEIEQFDSQLPVRYQFRGPQDPNRPLLGGDVSDLQGRGVGGIVPFTVLPGASVRNDILVAAQAPAVQHRSGTNNFALDSDTLALGANLKWQVNERAELAFDLGYSKGEQDRSQHSLLLQTFANANYDTRNLTSGVPDLYSTGTDLNDPANYRVAFGGRAVATTVDESTALAVDLDYQLDHWPLLTVFEAGLRYAERSKDQTSRLGNTFTGSGGVPAVVPASAIALRNFPVDNYMSDAAGARLNRRWLIGDPRAFHAQFNTPIAFDGLNSFNVEEKSFAAYLKANWQFDLGRVPVRGNVGLRLLQTDVAALGQRPSRITIRTAADFDVEGERTSTTTDYRNVLPSLNLSAELSEQLLLRFGAARTLTRPTLSQLSPRFTFNTTTLTANSGSPDLEPFESDSYDLSLEWYFRPGGLLSIAAFRKDIGGFIFNASRPETVAGVAWQSVTRPLNAAEASIDGFELNLQSELDFLPAPFSGLGVLANYTFADSSTGFGNDPRFAGQTFSYTGLSKHVYNLVGYYERGPASLRLSYNFRGDYLLEPQFGFFSGPRSVNDYAQIDLSASYVIDVIGRAITLTFAATNLGNERYNRFFDNDKSQIASTSYTGRQFFFGVRGDF